MSILARVTRLAPSPTGALHLGNARTFLINWLMARQMGWKVVLRIEDLDGPRVKKGADVEAMEDLRWLGMDWDEGPIYQSSRKAVYAEAVYRLLKEGEAYACTCTRKEVGLAASAPHAEDGATIYPGTCRGRYAGVEEAQKQSGRAPCVRFAVAQRAMDFDDGFLGPQRFEMDKLGDFVIEKADQTAAYQLAVVIDDATMGVTDVVRGRDLLDSTPRQTALYEALGMTDQIPKYWHLPLVVGTDGRRLAKRHGDTRLSYYRSMGVSTGRVLGLLARWSGMEGDSISTAADLLNRFDLGKMPKETIVFSQQDDRWLKGNQ